MSEDQQTVGKQNRSSPRRSGRYTVAKYDSNSNSNGNKDDHYDDLSSNACKERAVSNYKEWNILLPRQLPAHTGKKTLVLDLDETLLHSSFKPVPRYDFLSQIIFEEKVQIVYVIKRPGVEHFMKAMARIYELVVFTASLRSYADPLLDELDVHNAISHRLYRESCREYGGGLVKDLSFLGRDISNTIIVDNNPCSYALQPDNALPISSFFDDLRDRELMEIMAILFVLADLDDVTEALAKTDSSEEY